MVEALLHQTNLWEVRKKALSTYSGGMKQRFGIAQALLALEGQMWSRIVATDEELRTLESQLQIVSTHLVGGLHEIRVFAPSSPGADFRPVASGLEDVYFLNLSRRSKN